MVTANLKGVTDYAPEVMARRQQIIDVLRRNFTAYGYRPLETALLNYRDLLTYKYGEQAEIVKEIYQLHDQGERDLGLRFDLTVPFCKFIALNRSLKMPFRRYEIGKVFRNGPVKTGRLREFVQCDVDVVGDSGRAIEAELIELSVRCFRELGLPIVVQIGHRQLLTGLIARAGGAANAEAIIAILDKVQKVTPAETLAALQKYLPPAAAQELLQNVGLDLPALAELLPDNPGIAELKELFGLLDALGLTPYYRLTPGLARGLNIYTGVVWEVFDATGNYHSSLGGGGRYDQIITNFVANGQAYPAVGMSFGLDPISTLRATTDPGDAPQLLLVPLDTYPAAVNLANNLRAAGLRVLVWTGKPKVGKALEYATALGIRRALVLGETEITTGRAAVKDLSTGQETAVNLAAVPDVVRAITSN